MICEVKGAHERMAIARRTLEALPDWFGLPESTENYIKMSAEHPVLAAFEGDQAVGFLMIEQHSPHAAEIGVMGILPEYHRRGIGRALVADCEAYCRERGIEYLQVKTLDDRHPDEHYAKTRAFYRSVGFRSLECFPSLWDEDNPCLVMIKYIAEEKATC